MSTFARARLFILGMIWGMLLSLLIVLAKDLSQLDWYPERHHIPPPQVKEWPV